MSHTTRPTDTPAGQQQSRSQNVQPTEMTGWVGWIAFAGVMMMLLGSFHVIQGLVADAVQDRAHLVRRGRDGAHVLQVPLGYDACNPDLVQGVSHLGLRSRRMSDARRRGDSRRHPVRMSRVNIWNHERTGLFAITKQG